MAWYTSKSPSSSNPYLDNINPEKIKQAKENLKVEFNPTPEFVNGTLADAEPIQTRLDKIKAFDIKGLLNIAPPIQSRIVPPIISPFPAHTSSRVITPFAAHTPTAPPQQPSLLRSFNAGVSNSALGSGVLRGIAGSSYDPSRLDYDPKTIGEKIAYGVGNIGADLPLWMAGDALLAKPLGALAKTAPIAKATSLLPKALTPALETGIKAGATYGGVVAPVETAIQGDGLQGLIDREKELPYMALGGVALHGAGQLLGKGISEANNALIDRKISKLINPIESNPLQDVQSAYRNPISLRDAKQQQYENIFSDTSKPMRTVQNTSVLPPLSGRSMTDAELLVQRQLDAQSAFGEPLNSYKLTTSQQRAYQARQAELEAAFKDLPIGSVDTPLVRNTLQQNIDNSLGIGTSPQKTLSDLEEAFGKPRQVSKYQFKTSEQKALEDLQQGIKDAQDFLGDNKLINDFSGENFTVEASYDNIKHYTGIDLPKLISNWEKSQTVRASLSPEELRLGRVSGVIPNLKPRDIPIRNIRQSVEQSQRLGISGTLPENIQPRIRPNIPLKPRKKSPTIEPLQMQRILPEKPKPLQWTNRDNIQGAGPLPLRSITPENLGELPKSKSMAAKIETPINTSFEPSVRIEMPVLRNSRVKNRTMAADIETPSTPNTPTISMPLNSTPSTSSSSGPRIVSSFNKEKIPFAEKLQRIYRETVNNTQGIDRTVKGTRLTGADNPVVMTTNARNAGGTVDHIINKGLVDMSGKPVVNGSVADAFKLPKEKQQAFDEYLYHLHNVDRMREGKPVFDNETSISESRKAIVDLENAHPEFKEKASVVRKTLDELLNKWGVDSGLVAPELRDALQEMYKNYVPTYRSLEGANAIATKTRTAGAAKIINKAVGGEEPLITLRESIPMLINKTVKAARKNEVYKGILEATRANPQNGFAKILGEDVKASESLANSVRNDGLEGIAANSEKALEADPKLGYLLTVMEEGKPVKLQINKELFDSLQALNKVDDTSLHKALRTVKKYATNPFKALITGYNPFFALRNVARDIPTAYIQGTENNPFKFVGNLGTAAKDMVTKNPRYKEFQALGGQGSNFFNIEKGGIQTPGKLKKVGQKVGNVISSVNNFTETLPRYGEYVGTLKRGGEGYSNKMQGLHNAAEVTVNFGRHGDLTKVVDAVVPYLNPAVQGLDKFRKTLLKPSSYAKALGVITVPTAGIYALNQAIDKNGYDQLDNRTKDTYYLIPEGNGKFIKIAKTREAGVLFGTLFERIARTVEGQSEPFKGFPNTLKTNFIPNDPISSNFFSPLINAKYTNKDFANREIVPSYMTDYSPRYQYDEKTSEIAKTIGDKLNLSPKQIDYLIKSYTGVVGSLLLPATTKGGPTVGNVISRNFTADANYNNEIQNNFYDKMSELRRVANDKNVSQNIPSKVVTNEEAKYNAMAKISKDMSAIRKEQLKAQQSGNQAKADLLQAKLLQMAKTATK